MKFMVFEDFMFGFVIGILFTGVIGAKAVDPKIRQQVMAEAYSYGYAVECLGKEGYYWECEGELK